MSSSKCIIISCCTVAVRPYIILVLLWSSDVTGVAAPLAIWHNEQWGGRSLIDPFQIVSALQDSLTFCKGQTFINPMVLIQSTPLCPPLFAEDFCQIQQNFWDFFTRQDPVLSLPEGYYLACRCSVPWTSLKRCWKRSYWDPLYAAFYETLVCMQYGMLFTHAGARFRKSNHITMYHMQLVRQKRPLPRPLFEVQH